MGLDQYAYIRKNTKQFTWRKHSKLQQFMEDIWYKDLGNTEEFNCRELVLSKDMLERLLKRINNNTLPESDGGFFYGHEYQDDAAKENKEQDTKFCKEAIKAIDNGHTVVYSCWW